MERPMSIADIKNYLNSFPPGYKFDPSDDELIVEYLVPKINATNLPLNLMHDVNIYDYNPDYLAATYSCQGNKGWYFFTPRSKKYKNGKRPNRKAGDGFWKATGADKVIFRNEVAVGYRKALVFYMGRPPKGQKTLWIMHEFRVAGPSQVRENLDNDNEDTSMRLDDFVLCRIYEKNEGSPPSDKPQDEQEVPGDQSSESVVEKLVKAETSSKDNDDNNDVNMYDISNESDYSNVESYHPTNNDGGHNGYDPSTTTGIHHDHRVHNAVGYANAVMYNPGYNYGGYPTTGPTTGGSISGMNDKPSTTSTSDSGLLDFDPYQTCNYNFNFNYYNNFSEDPGSDFYYTQDDNDPSILHLLSDPQNPTMADPNPYPYPYPNPYQHQDPDPSTIFQPPTSGAIMSNPPPQDPTDQREVKDVPRLPPKTRPHTLPCRKM